ncbi:MAG: stage II sporulation protein P [Ruminococcus sp.]|nr:stage II sporulation protein P [Ruminococcus sp.]
MKQFKFKKRKLKFHKSYLIILSFIGSLFIAIFLSNNNSFANILTKNTYGFTNYNYYDNLLYKNAYGLNFKQTKIVNETDFKPIIYIYNTFQTDKYKSSYNNTYNINSLVTQGSLILADYLKTEGYPSLVETNSVVKVLKDNDTPYTKSYRGSRVLLEQAINDYPSLSYFIDLQIASAHKEVIIDDLKYAKINFVIGKDYDSFRENEKLALVLNNMLNNSFSNISSIEYRSGEGYHGVYNEDVNSNLLLIEVGSNENTITEVNRSLKILAQIYAIYLKENI